METKIIIESNDKILNTRKLDGVTIYKNGKKINKKKFFARSYSCTPPLWDAKKMIWWREAFLD